MRENVKFFASGNKYFLIVPIFLLFAIDLTFNSGDNYFK